MIELMGLAKGMPIPDKPPTKVPLRENRAFIGTLTQKVKNLDKKRTEQEGEFDRKCRYEWKSRN